MISSVYFYVSEIPESVSQISYRLIIDGLWTTDPLNPATVFDRNTFMKLSSLPIERDTSPATEVQKKMNAVKFIYTGESGQTIRLGGSFTNWDSYIYELAEISPGIYELDLPLPKGIYFYTFFNGVTALLDTANPRKAYTADGRIASIIEVN